MNLADLTSFNLTPAEMNKVLYHRANLAKPGVDENGYPVTIYATGIEIPEGPNKGKFVSVPGFVGGKIVENDDELWKIWKKDILADKYPVYPDAKTLNKRDQELHKIMELDMQAMPQEKMVNPMYADPFGNSIQ
jgi:hypothetical protein